MAEGCAWEDIDEFSEDICSACRCKNSEELCNVCRCKNMKTASLIAVAPELLHYARLFYEYLIDFIDDPEDFRVKAMLEAENLFRRIDEEENSNE